MDQATDLIRRFNDLAQETVALDKAFGRDIHLARLITSIASSYEQTLDNKLMPELHALHLDKQDRLRDYTRLKAYIRDNHPDASEDVLTTINNAQAELELANKRLQSILCIEDNVRSIGELVHRHRIA